MKEDFFTKKKKDDFSCLSLTHISCACFWLFSSILKNVLE